MRPAPPREGDALPSPDDFAGWPPLGALGATVVAGPVVAEMRRIDARVKEALADFDSERPRTPLPMHLEWTRADRRAWLGVAAGERARSVGWLESGGLAWATHHVALLMDASAERGIVVMTDQDAAEAARSAQNVLRVATAWRLAASERGLLVHASAVDAGGEAVVFVGPSGAGKTTAVELSQPRAILADDACILLRGDEGAVLAPAPFWADSSIPRRRDGDARMNVRAIVRLRQASQASLRPMPRAAATATLLAHAPFLEGLVPPLRPSPIAESLASRPRMAELEFGKNPSFWRVLEDAWESR